MSRSGYYDGDGDEGWQWANIRWRGQVASATRGKRGQVFFKELLEALDAMPERRLIAEALQTADGEFCAMGVLGKKRGVDVTALDPEDPDSIADAFDVAHQLVREVEYMNDDYFHDLTPEQRWSYVRAWVAGRIK